MANTIRYTCLEIIVPGHIVDDEYEYSVTVTKRDNSNNTSNHIGISSDGSLIEAVHQRIVKREQITFHINNENWADEIKLALEKATTVYFDWLRTATTFEPYLMTGNCSKTRIKSELFQIAFTAHKL